MELQDFLANAKGFNSNIGSTRRVKTWDGPQPVAMERGYEHDFLTILKQLSSTGKAWSKPLQHPETLEWIVDFKGKGFPNTPHTHPLLFVFGIEKDAHKFIEWHNNEMEEHE